MKTSVMLCAALGGFLFGYDTSVINGALFQMKDHFGFDDHSWIYGLIVAIAIAGAFVGAFASGFISARFGRRPSILIADILFIVGSVLMAAAPNVAVILVSRVIVGLAIGISSATIPVYLAEVTSPKHRGATIVLNNVFLTGAQFIASGFTALMVVYTSENVGWRIAIGVGSAPAVVQLVCVIFFLPESPRWLMCKGSSEEAKLVATRFEVDLGEYDESELKSVDMDYRSLLKPDIRFRVMLGCALQIIQQFSGINTIMYYSSVILYDAGFHDPIMPVILSIPLAFMNALFTMIAVFTVDKVGRRVLLIASCAGCLITTAVVSIIGFMLDKQIPYSIGGWLFLALLSVFLAFYAPGIGCIPWVMMGEIFPTHLRTSAASVATMANWGANVLVSQVFPILLGAIGVGGTFAIIVGLLALGLVFLWFFAVETKGLTLEQVDNLFRRRAGLEPHFHSGSDEEIFRDMDASMLGDDAYLDRPNEARCGLNNLADAPSDGFSEPDADAQAAKEGTAGSPTSKKPATNTEGVDAAAVEEHSHESSDDHTGPSSDTKSNEKK
uniref:Myo-inositol/H symporter 1 n=1 Tax=Herpetomonas muscarum TaxID=5718 RepID=A0A0C5K0X8_HERMU|nr:myo-inositol/H symporter 1 [Herpetomonas muscarum]